MKYFPLIAAGGIGIVAAMFGINFMDHPWHFLCGAAMGAAVMFNL